MDFEGRKDAVAKREDAVSKVEKQEQSQDFRYDCENFARIVKILLGLRKFRNHSENFAILAKLGIFSRLAKFTVPSKIFQFRYLTNFSLG